jgi:glycosyltransferase involved in cell wall biosynthesis
MARGGLSEWANLLIKTLKDMEFEVWCIGPTGKEKRLYEKPHNVNQMLIKPVVRNHVHKKTSPLPKAISTNLADSLGSALRGVPLDCKGIAEARERYPIERGWLTSREYWDSIVDFYKENFPERPFVEYFWTTFGLYSILLDTIYFAGQLPVADVYISLTTGLGGFMGSMAKALYGSPLIVIEQGLYLVEKQDEVSRQDISEWERHQIIKFSKSLIKTSYRYSDWIVPPCYSHTVIERELGADLDKIKVINNGIECDKFRPGPERSESPLVIGCFARVIPLKGIIILIRAAKSVLEKHQAIFVVAGEVQNQEYYHECQALVEELGLKGRFRFVGHANSLEWYRRVDIFVLPSLSEGVPYALLEAMSCGLPCVCTAVGGVPETLPDGIAGYVVPPNDPDSLAEKICKLLEDGTLRKRMGQQATELISEKYSIEKVAGEFRRLCEGLLNGSSRF